MSVTSSRRNLHVLLTTVWTGLVPIGAAFIYTVSIRNGFSQGYYGPSVRLEGFPSPARALTCGKDCSIDIHTLHFRKTTFPIYSLAVKKYSLI